jgi:hypothetical protein
LPAFDLTQLDQTYFDRLRARVLQLQQNGIYSIVELFDGLGLASNRCANDGYPFTGGNNVNGVNDGGGTNSMTMASPNTITGYQDAFVQKVIDTVNDLPNVLWEISEEAPDNSTWWQGHMIGLIHTYEKGGTWEGVSYPGKSFQHPVGYPTLNVSLPNDPGLYNSNADWVAPAARFSPTSSCGTGTPACKVNINDSDHSYFGMWNDSAQTNRNYVWENFTNGSQVLFMDPYLIYWTSGNRNLCQSPSNGVCTGPDTRWDNLRNNLGYTVSYANKMNLVKMTPQGSLSSTGYCLANNMATGAEYLVYAPNGGSFTVNLSAVPTTGTVTVEWLDPSTGTTTSGGSVPGGSTRTFTPPFSGDAVLYLVDPPSSPLAPTITTQPASQTVTAGQTATFTVVAGGTAPLSYQWQKNGVDIAGATSASYTTPATATTDSGSTFDVVVSNTAGTVTSATATLTVNAAASPAIQLSTTSIIFGNVVVGSNLSQALIIKNTGTATLSISQITPTGAGFSVSGFTLPLSVNAGQQTTITVAFAPASVGAVTGGITIVSNAPISAPPVTLSGSGIAATLTLSISPTSLNFGNVTTGTTSASQNVTITNTGNANITISQITASAGYTLTGGGTPVTVSPSQSLTLGAQFRPTAAGSVTGSISIASNATGSPATVTLSGTGVALVQHSVALTWNASTSTVAGYNVYRTTTSGTGYVKINASLVGVLNYTDSTVQNATTYYYVTTAVDASANESGYSNEVSAPIP